MKRLYQELDLDLTGVNVSNYIQGEPHTLSAKHLRALVPDRGLYYADSVTIRDGARELIPGEDYFHIQLHQVLTMRTGKEVVPAIIINNPAVGSEITISYQAVGGPYATDNTMLSNLLDSIVSGIRTYSWFDIKDKPSYFKPTKHGHYIGDIKGWEPIIYALERIRNTKTLNYVDIIKSIIENLDDPYEWQELSLTLPTRENIRHDDMLYHLSRKKLLSDVWIDTATAYWTTGKMNKIKIDTSSYPVGTKFYWEFYKRGFAPIYRPVEARGVAEGNGSIVYIDIYVPSSHSHDDEIIYLGVRLDPNKEDYDATSKHIRIKDMLSTDSSYGLMANLRGGYDDTMTSPALYDDGAEEAYGFITRHRTTVNYE